MNIKEFQKAAARFTKNNKLCKKCVGVGCLPKNFGIGNPNAKPCYKCRGRGWIRVHPAKASPQHSK